MRPRFLQALDHVDATDSGHIADCPICRDILLIEPDHQNLWTLACDGGCTHDELVRWLAITDLRVNPDYGPHAWLCLMLATNPDMWQALIRGEHIPDEALDRTWLNRLRKARLWVS